ncbi:MAG: hypothetical protein ACLGH4_07750, partial [Actinomycetes bacterium]
MVAALAAPWLVVAMTSSGGEGDTAVRMPGGGVSSGSAAPSLVLGGPTAYGVVPDVEIAGSEAAG